MLSKIDGKSISGNSYFKSTNGTNKSIDGNIRSSNGIIKSNDGKSKSGGLEGEKRGLVLIKNVFAGEKLSGYVPLKDRNNIIKSR